MCIRDRYAAVGERDEKAVQQPGRQSRLAQGGDDYREVDVCLLYTSDAADERSSVDLGGRRIIKKNKHVTRDSKPQLKHQH